MSTLTRKQVAQLLGISADRVGALDRAGRLPCKSTTLSYLDEENMPRRTRIYPKDVILSWVEKGGHRAEFKPKGRKSRNIISNIGMTFLLTHSQREELAVRKAKAILNKPATKVERIISDWY